MGSRGSRSRGATRAVGPPLPTTRVAPEFNQAPDFGRMSVGEMGSLMDRQMTDRGYTVYRPSEINGYVTFEYERTYPTRQASYSSEASQRWISPAGDRHARMTVNALQRRFGDRADSIDRYDASQGRVVIRVTVRRNP